VSRIAPRLVSVWVGGDALEGFATAAPTSHLKVFLPADGQTAPILPYYRTKGILSAIDGMGEMDAVTRQIETIIAA